MIVSYRDKRTRDFAEEKRVKACSRIKRPEHLKLDRLGCLYFDSAAEGFTLDARMRQTILELRDFAVLAISRKRLPCR
jgi:hypothetical protein